MSEHVSLNTTTYIGNFISRLLPDMQLANVTELIPVKQFYNDALHSSFDKSKFAVVGNPTITSNGIASGFSASNYLTAIKLLPEDKPWEINYEYTISENDIGNTNSKNFIYNTAGDKGIILIWLNWNPKVDYIDFIINLEDRTQATVRVASMTKFVANDKLNINIGFSGSEYYQKTYVNDVLIQEKTITSTVKVRQSDTGYLTIGARPGSSNFCQGQVNLKQFSIEVDGREVFLGNKTGIDTIIPDNYTVVGTPTITEDGILSNCDNTNYIKTPNLDLTGEFEIRIPFKRRSNPSANKTFLLFNGGSTPVNIYFTQYAALEASFGSPVVYHALAGALRNNVDMEFVITPNDTKLYINGVLKATKANSEALKTALQSNTNIVFRPNGDIGAEIDLNTQRVYSQGTLVYQPCLKLPYEITKYNTKVVKAQYRDRVQRAIGTNGVSHYFIPANDDIIYCSSSESLQGYYSIEENN